MSSSEQSTHPAASATHGSPPGVVVETASGRMGGSNLGGKEGELHPLAEVAACDAVLAAFLPG